MAVGQFSSFWWAACIWCNTCGGRCQRIPAALHHPTAPPRPWAAAFLLSAPSLSSLPHLYYLLFFPLFHALSLRSPSGGLLCVHMWSRKQVTGILGKAFVSLRGGERVTTGLNTSHGPSVPLRVLFREGASHTHFQGPRGTYSWDAGCSDYLDEETCTCTATAPPPHLKFNANSHRPPSLYTSGAFSCWVVSCYLFTAAFIAALSFLWIQGLSDWVINMIYFYLFMIILSHFSSVDTQEYII